MLVVYMTTHSGLPRGARGSYGVPPPHEGDARAGLWLALFKSLKYKIDCSFQKCTF